MTITCPDCGFTSEVNPELLPADTVQVRCPRCRNSFQARQGTQPVVASPEPSRTDGFRCPKCDIPQQAGASCIRCGVVFSKVRTPPPAEPTSPEAPEVPDADFGEEPGWVNIVNIIALLFLIDSSLSLIMRLPALPEILSSPNGMSFHLKAKYLYDALMAAAMFVSSFGLSMRKKWARISVIVLLGLGCAEGLYMLAYQHVAVAELEKNTGESFSELKNGNTAKWIGLGLYVWFIIMLCRRRVAARFR